ncbi:13493_t:CDS:10, partial [Funneliformis caledonium]
MYIVVKNNFSILEHKTVASLDIVNVEDGSYAANSRPEDEGRNDVDERIWMMAPFQEGLLTGCKISGELKALRGHGSDRERSSLDARIDKILNDDDASTHLFLYIIISCPDDGGMIGLLSRRFIDRVTLRGHGSNRERSSLFPTVLCDGRSDFEDPGRNIVDELIWLASSQEGLLAGTSVERLFQKDFDARTLRGLKAASNEIAIQCKNWANKIGIVVAPSGYTSGAKKAAREHSIILTDVEDLCDDLFDKIAERQKSKDRFKLKK